MIKFGSRRLETRIFPRQVKQFVVFAAYNSKNRERRCRRDKKQRQKVAHNALP